MRLRRAFSTAALSLSLLLPAAGIAGAESPVKWAKWDVKGDFADGTRKDLSGAACADPAGLICVVVNDQKNKVQFFTAVDGQKIVPRADVKLTDDDGEIDAEGAAFEPVSRTFYVTGSHGHPRHKDELNPASYVVYRFRANDDLDRLVGLESSTKLRGIMESVEAIAAFVDRPLANGKPGVHGANIEGIAADRDRLWFGFRGPVAETGGADAAPILSVRTDALFGGGDPGAEVHLVALGKGMGVRDLAAVAGGFLILSGLERDEAGDSAVFFWDGTSAKPDKLFAIKDMPDNAKPETIVVLDDEPERTTILLIFENEKNGKPRKYTVKR